jgi:hypothetical protein
MKDNLRRWRAEGRIPQHVDWTGRKHSDESKQKIGAANAIRQRGEGNSQFGTVWIFNCELNQAKKIKRVELSEWINKGWLPGRKSKS